MTTERVEIENVFYLYKVGNSFVAIWTDPKKQWGNLPDYLRVEFVIERPGEWEEISKAVNRAIRAKVAEQKKQTSALSGKV